MPSPSGSVDDPGHGGRPGVDAAVGTVTADRCAVQFVGAGPGAADLLTVRATRLLTAADTVLYPGSYLDHEVLESCSPAADLIDTQNLDLDEIVARIVDAHRAGRRVVRLVSGDPTLYSAVSEQSRRLDSAGVPWEITPGVPAYAAAAARVGRELTVPLVAQSVVLTRTQARSTAMPDTESLAAFAATRATLVLHLAITRTRALMDELCRRTAQAARSWWCTGPPSRRSASFVAPSQTSPIRSRRPGCATPP